MHKEIKAVIGANFGDEGKGLTANYFAEQFKNQNKKCVIVCSNGGAQRGHTVCLPSGFRHVFHHFGSGTFNLADTYFSKYFILNPIEFIREYQELKNIININVYAHPNCIVSTPYDMLFNQLLEKSRGNKRHGSTGFGIWETIKRSNLDSNLNLTFKDILNLDINCLINFIKNIRKYFINQISYFNDKDNEFFYSDDLFYHFIDDLILFKNLVKVCDDNILHKYDAIVFENGQGLLLDQNRTEFGDHTTPSNTGSKNIFNILQSANLLNSDIELSYVTRTYLTRHGAGPFKEECDYRNICNEINDKTNVYNLFQGSIRYGKLNKSELYERIIHDYKSMPWEKYNNVKISCAITHINEYDDITQDFSFLSKFSKIYTSNNELTLNELS